MARTGRPRAFDVDLATDQAMRLFWTHGFESASLDQLKSVMGGISSASFYAAFGSKEKLFRAAIDRYLASFGQVTAPLFNPDLPPREALFSTLVRSARMQTDASHPKGCMVVVSAATTSAENAHLQAFLAQERGRTREAIHTVVARAVTTGALGPQADVAGLATLFDGFLVGICVQARDGVPAAQIEKAIDRLAVLWDTEAAQPQA